MNNASQFLSRSELQNRYDFHVFMFARYFIPTL